MINVRIEEKSEFLVAGRKIWISGQDNEQFGEFWRVANENGLVSSLRKLSKNSPGKNTNSCVFGVSCVEKDPNNRAFNFFIATEINNNNIDDLEIYLIPSAKWVIFSNHGELPMSLIEAKIYAFREWLPTSGYQHAYAPELEVYPVHDNTLVEFWLPIM